MAMKWYVIQTYSGFEVKVRDNLLARVKQHHLDDQFGEIFIPIEEIEETRPGGKTRKRKKISYPGYIFVEMEMSEKAWHLVKDTPKVGGFIGDQKPQEVDIKKIKETRDRVAEGMAHPKSTVTYEVGDEVRILKDPFANFHGTVDEVKADKHKLAVMVSMFGRPTRIELDFNAVEKRK